MNDLPEWRHVRPLADDSRTGQARRNGAWRPFGIGRVGATTGPASRALTGAGLLAWLAAGAWGCGSVTPDSSNTQGAAAEHSNAAGGAAGGTGTAGASGPTSAGAGGNGETAGNAATAGNSGANEGGLGTGGSGGTTVEAGGVSSGGGDSGLGGTAGGAAAGGAAAGGAAAGGAAPGLSACPRCARIFDGASLNGWVQVPPSSWSVVNGAMHSLGTARGFIYTADTYADFRFIFSSRLVKDPANHFPCVLFWGNSPTKDALSAIQIQPPAGYMWDYRTTGPTSNKSPDMYEKRFGHPAFVDTEWSQCEMLGNLSAGKLRFACCQSTGNAPCTASEVVDFTDPTAGLKAPLALQVHNANMIEEFKDLYLESPVADPSKLLTVP
jgi:hypothetical protein